MLTKLHYMMKKYAFEYEKVILQGGVKGPDHQGSKYNSPGAI